MSWLWRCLLLLGSVYCFLVPPFQSPDEPNHFLRAWQVSEGRFFPEKKDNRLGGMLPESLSAVCDSFLFLKNNPTARLSGKTWQNAWNTPLHGEKRRFTDFANTAIYTPVGYLPQACAIAILRPFGATPLQMLYGARLANLLAWICLVMAAWRLIPFFKNTLAALALLPATLCIAASANADVLYNGLCWWLIAALLALPETVPLWKKLAATTLVAAGKLIAAPLALAGRDKKQTAMLIAAAVVAAGVWGAIARDWFIPYDAYNPTFRDSQTLNSGVNPAAQLDFMLKNPVTFVGIAVKSCCKALPSMAAHFVGKFGWEKNYLPAPWILLLWLALAALIFSEKNLLSRQQRWKMAGIGLLYWGAFAITMYALWHAVGSPEITNWQGRYFIPVAPVLALAAGGARLEKWRKEIEIGAATVFLLSNLVMFWSVWARYWAEG